MSLIRIRAVANLINDNNIVVDIGSDHALLSIILITEKRSKKVINIEKNDLPFLNSVKSTIEFFNQIENIKSDGFKNIKKITFIDTCTIMGMGGNSILKILDDASSQNVGNYILQPNNNVHKLRKWAKENNWKISFETLVEENKIIYELLIFNKFIGYEPMSEKDLFFGRINLKNNSDIFRKKWNLKLNKIIENNLDNFNYSKYKEFKLISEILENECKTTS